MAAESDISLKNEEIIIVYENEKLSLVDVWGKKIRKNLQCRVNNKWKSC